MAPELENAISQVLATSVKAGKKCGIYCSGGDQARKYADLGVDMISVATDWTTLDSAVGEQLLHAKGLATKSKGVSY